MFSLLFTSLVAFTVSFLFRSRSSFLLRFPLKDLFFLLLRVFLFLFPLAPYAQVKEKEGRKDGWRGKNSNSSSISQISSAFMTDPLSACFPTFCQGRSSSRLGGFFLACLCVCLRCVSLSVSDMWVRIRERERLLPLLPDFRYKWMDMGAFFSRCK